MTSTRSNDTHWHTDPQQPLLSESHIIDTHIQPHDQSSTPSQNMPGIMLARPTFSWPGLVIGLLIGTIYCITNIFLGLKTGQISGAPIATAFFAPLLSKRLKLRLNGEQIMFTITVSTAVAIMSLAGGFVGPIPALTQLLGPEERVEEPINLSWLQLTTFAATLSISGPMFAMLMRGHFLGSGRLDELPFPTATATAKVIRAYSDGMRDEDKDQALGSRVAADDRRSDQRTSESIAEDRNRCAICGISLSLIYAALTWPFPSGANAPWPIKLAAKYSNWVDFSPGVIGQGFIIGLQIVYEMSLGAIFGWVILPWFLHITNCTTGDEDQGRESVRAWALWLSLVTMLADCSIKILWTAWHMSARQPNEASDRANETQSVGRSWTGDESVSTAGPTQFADSSASLSGPVLVPALVVLAPLCVFFVRNAIGNFMPWIETLAVILILPLPVSYLSILATGKTDYTPASPLGRFSQIAIAPFDKSSAQNAFMVNIVMGAIVESAACQAAAMMSKLKAGETMGANPYALFWGQVSGSFAGAFVAGLFFRYVMCGKLIKADPKSRFKMPGAYMFLEAAKLALNGGLPSHATDGAVILGIVFCITAALKIRFDGQTWVDWLPSGTAFATGMYNVPAITINWVLGGLIGHYWKKQGDETAMTLCGSGLMVGEGISGLILGWLPRFE